MLHALHGWDDLQIFLLILHILQRKGGTFLVARACC